MRLIRRWRSRRAEKQRRRELALMAGIERDLALKSGLPLDEVRSTLAWARKLGDPPC